MDTHDFVDAAREELEEQDNAFVILQLTDNSFIYGGDFDTKDDLLRVIESLSQLIIILEEKYAKLEYGGEG